MLGIFGGTFDPIHYGHLRPAAEVQRALGLDPLYLVPAAMPPHRQAPVATAAQRLHMAQLAVAEFPGLTVDDREICRGGISYTVDTLQSCRDEWPDSAIALLMGADAYAGIESWHQWPRLLELAHLVVMRRPGWADTALPGWAEERISESAAGLTQTSHGRIYFQSVAPQAISATAIRDALARGESVDGSLPSTVLEFIRKNRIYQKGQNTE